MKSRNAIAAAVAVALAATACSKPESESTQTAAETAAEAETTAVETVATEAPDGSGQVFLKGGSWASSDPAQLRGAMHMMALPTDTSADVGFRCVSDR